MIPLRNREVFVQYHMEIIVTNMLCVRLTFLLKSSDILYSCYHLLCMYYEIVYFVFLLSVLYTIWQNGFTALAHA